MFSRWLKSSRTGQGDNANCVEVWFDPERVRLRDSKDPEGQTFELSHHNWQLFTTLVAKRDAAQVANYGSFDKSLVRDNLDLIGLKWIGIPNCLEYAFVLHDSAWFTVVRQGDNPQRLVFTPSEWEYFVDSIPDGEFDSPKLAARDMLAIS